MRLLPERHDHDDHGAAGRQSASDRGRSARGAALQSVPLRRACRDPARRDARGRVSPPRSRRWQIRIRRWTACSPAALVVARPPGARSARPSRPSSAISADGAVTAFTAMSISARASAPRWPDRGGRTRCRLRACRDGARRYVASRPTRAPPSPARPSRSRGAAAPGGGAGATIPARRAPRNGSASPSPILPSRTG